jgi:hypothetical protein
MNLRPYQQQAIADLRMAYGTGAHHATKRRGGSSATLATVQTF